MTSEKRKDIDVPYEKKVTDPYKQLQMPNILISKAGRRSSK